MNIQQITALPKEMCTLAAAAKADGHRNIETLVREFESGENRFGNCGEGLFLAYDAGILIGIGGVNVDPFESPLRVARVRRLFVALDTRRRGVATALMQHIEDLARVHFARIQLFTDSEVAGRFYVSRGYAPVYNRVKVSHEKVFGVLEPDAVRCQD